MPRKLLIALTLALLLAGFAAPIQADDLAEKSRAILTKNQHAVVTVEIVLKLSYSSSGRTSTPQERKQEITGTIVDPSGLTVVALSACDPADVYQRMASAQSGYKIETEVSDLKLLLEDGTELPAEIVLRDKDLDLAYLRPKTKPASPMTAVDLGKSGTAEPFDEVVAINRLHRAASRAYSGSLERICAVVQKPRTFYIPDSTMSATTMGSPAFLMNGNVLGLFVLRAVSPSGGDADATAIIIPAEDVLKGAKQAPEAKGDSEKKSDAADSAKPKESGEKK
jgi:S1-C subfamily serine protease